MRHESHDFIVFELERIQSHWENVVDYNITESGVHPLSIHELVQDPDLIEDLLNMALVYPQTNGTPELRDAIAALYTGATRDNVIVTVGAAQANFTSIMTLLEPGDELAVMIPNYMQIWGAAHKFGFTTRAFRLVDDLAGSGGWRLDIDQLNDAVNDKTKVIAICNPNNPTGYILTAAEMDAVIAAADRVGAWVLADEVYAGAEHTTDNFTPSVYGRYDKVLAINSMSKAYGLPGLRVGWVVAPETVVDAIWQRQDYITIATTPMSNILAAYALSPDVRPRILERTRRYARQGFANFERWNADHPGLLSYVPPQAAAIVFAKYYADINSTALVHRLIQDQSTLVVSGDTFGMDQHLRLGFGQAATYVNEALDRLAAVLQAI